MKIFGAAVGGLTGILCAGFLQSCNGGGYIAGGTDGVCGRIDLATP
jgi:hypothetical protein